MIVNTMNFDKPFIAGVGEMPRVFNSLELPVGTLVKYVEAGSERCDLGFSHGFLKVRHTREPLPEHLWQHALSAVGMERSFYTYLPGDVVGNDACGDIIEGEVLVFPYTTTKAYRD